MIHIADGWKDYSVLATGDGYKLERWGEHVLLLSLIHISEPTRH